LHVTVRADGGVVASPDGADIDSLPGRGVIGGSRGV
jgi:hypothetical protein